MESGERNAASIPAFTRLSVFAEGPHHDAAHFVKEKFVDPMGGLRVSRDMKAQFVEVQRGKRVTGQQLEFDAYRVPSALICNSRGEISAVPEGCCGYFNGPKSGLIGSDELATDVIDGARVNRGIARDYLPCSLSAEFGINGKLDNAQGRHRTDQMRIE